MKSNKMREFTRLKIIRAIMSDNGFSVSAVGQSDDKEREGNPSSCMFAYYPLATDASNILFLCKYDDKSISIIGNKKRGTLEELSKIVKFLSETLPRQPLKILI